MDGIILDTEKLVNKKVHPIYKLMPIWEIIMSKEHT